MNKRARDTRAPWRLPMAIVLGLSLLATACGGISQGEIDARMDILRAEPAMTTAPPGATVVRVFEREPTSTWIYATESGGSILTVWATTASFEELELWYKSTFDQTYDFYQDARSDRSRGLITLADRGRTPSGSYMSVRIASTELTTSPPFNEQTYNQQTHPGMTFVAARVGQ